MTDVAPPDPSSPWSRRSVVRTGVVAAWAAPAIVAVGAAPATAASPNGTLALVAGSTSDYTDPNFHFIVFSSSAAVRAVGRRIEANTLTMTIAYRGNANDHQLVRTPTGWVLVGTGTPSDNPSLASRAASWTWRWPSAVEAGSTAPISGSDRFTYTRDIGGPSSPFDLTFAATGFTSNVTSYPPGS